MKKKLTDLDKELIQAWLDIPEGEYPQNRQCPFDLTLLKRYQGPNFEAFQKAVDEQESSCVHCGDWFPLSRVTLNGSVDGITVSEGVFYCPCKVYSLKEVSETAKRMIKEE